MQGLSEPARPRLAYGFWRYRREDGDIALAALAAAREAGIDHLDTADIYGGGEFGGVEALLGSLRQRAPSLFAGASLATKAGVEPGSPYNSSPDYMARACEASLKRLKLERIDLFYVHRPDILTHPAELGAALDALVQHGKAGAVGVSNFTPAQVDALRTHMTAPIASIQIEISAVEPSAIVDGRLDQAMRDGVSVLAWSPLAGGRLAAHASVHAELAAIAAKYNVSIESVALAFLLRHPAAITPIIGSTKPERITGLAQTSSLPLTRREWYAILEAALGRPMP
ncbi:MAG: aldo/keto reductase [Hyphomonadaceae bacterium]|nr:aldo/keto reductase [Hyphomonadaceae bacterium]